jgi:alpha-D-ribose 1-methylphosphonate 5-triphosphate synthase subunit PhnG
VKNDLINTRKLWLRLFALSSDQDLENTVRTTGIEQRCRTLVKPETGIVTVRARVSGNGEKFNVGDACVTKTVVLFDGTTKGYATVLGGQARRAVLVAMLDAAMAAGGEQPLTSLVQQLALTLEHSTKKRQQQAANTKVDFFTMVRGD